MSDINRQRFTGVRKLPGRNVEVMWLRGRLVPDHKAIADLRQDNGPAIVGSNSLPIDNIAPCGWPH